MFPFIFSLLPQIRFRVFPFLKFFSGEGTTTITLHLQEDTQGCSTADVQEAESVGST